MKQGDISPQIEVKKKVFQGHGLCEWDDKVIFIPDAVPQDKINARIVHNKRNFAFGKIYKLIEKSPARIDPPCEVFGKCGGCDWLNIDYDYQLKYKQEILDSFFGDLADEVHPVYGCKNTWHYRNKCFYPIALKDKKPVYGMFAKGSHRVVTHNDCKLQPQIFDKISEAFCQYIINTKETVYNERSGIGNIRHIGFRISPESEEILVIVVTAKRRIAFSKQLVRTLQIACSNIVGVVQNINPHKGNAIMGEDYKLLYGKPYNIITLNGLKFKLNFNAFFQINNETSSAMINFVREHISENDCVIDAFSGTGTIGLCISQKADAVIGIENSASAVKNARDNAELNNIHNCSFIKADVNEVIPNIIKREEPNTIIFDPPRKGLSNKTITTVADAGVKKIIYISCNPSTQLRDVKIFMEKGYNVIVRKGFDMFPHTWHIENIVILER